jgi:hypothetical protein
MSDSVDTVLRRAFCAEADQLPPEAIDRLLAVEFRPRTRRLSPKVAIGAAAGVGASTAAAVSLLVVGTAAPAFAGWEATPTTPAAGQLATAEAACRAHLAANSSAGSLDGPQSSPILTDVRGPYTVAVYAAGSADVTCFVGPSFVAVSGLSVTSTGNGASASASGFGSVSGANGAGPASAQSRSSVRRASGGAAPVGGSGAGISASHFTLSNGSPYSLVVGHVSGPLTSAVIERSSGSGVTATVADGWFEAWWPGTGEATSVKVTTPTGTTTLPIRTGPDGAPGASGPGQP